MLIPAVLRLASQPIAKSDRAERTVAVSRARNVGGSTGQEQQDASLANLFAHIGTSRGQAAVIALGSHARDLARESLPFEGLDPAQGRDEEPSSANRGSRELSQEEHREVEQLQQRDREVRTHEQAHKAAAGAHAGAIHLEYEAGPDGKRYASSGSVPIDVSPVPGDPEATLRKMEIVRKAALAPAEPSGADRQVASKASQTAQQALAQLAASRYETARNLAVSRRPGPSSDATTEASARSSSQSTSEGISASQRETPLGAATAASGLRREWQEPSAAGPAPPRPLGFQVLRYESSGQLAQGGRAAFFSHIG